MNLLLLEIKKYDQEEERIVLLLKQDFAFPFRSGRRLFCMIEYFKQS